MKKCSKITSLILIVMMLLGIAVLPAYAASDETPADDLDITISLRIEGVDECLYFNEAIALPEQSSVIDLIGIVNEIEPSLEIKVVESTYGNYVSQIGELVEFGYGGYSGWLFIKNGVSGVDSIAETFLADGDVIVFYYADPFGGPGFQFPQADVSKLFSDGIICFTSEDTDYDEDWNPVTSINPVAGAAVDLNGKQYITDENGMIHPDDTTGLSGVSTLQIERFDEESGVPTVLRYAPDHLIYIPFSDTAASMWYADAVEFCVTEGYFIGISAADNLFAPLGGMTMLQLFTVLQRIAGQEPAVTPIEWALANGIYELHGDEEDLFDSLYDLFSSMWTNRQQFIYMFYLTVELSGTHDMTPRADISGAVDYDDVAFAYTDSVAWAVATGIIRGTDPNALNINAAAEPTRAEVCQMLYNYYN